MGEWKPPRNSKKALRRRSGSILQGTGRPGSLQDRHSEHSASSLPAEGLPLVWKGAGSVNNRACCSVGGATTIIRACESRSTFKKICRALHPIPPNLLSLSRFLSFSPHFRTQTHLSTVALSGLTSASLESPTQGQMHKRTGSVLSE